jgi:Ca2+-binding RTX toxin-like protein
MATFKSVDHLPVDFSKFDLDRGIGVTDVLGSLSASRSSMYARWTKNVIGLYENSLTIKGFWEFGPTTVLGQTISPWVAIESGTVNSFDYSGVIEFGSSVKTSFTITDFEVPAKNMGKYFANPELYIFQGNDSITGSNVNDTLWGYGGDDRIYGRKGSDVLSGGAGDDYLDGGDDLDAAQYGGKRADYSVTLNAHGWTVRDLRTGSPDGADTLVNIERIAFADGVVDLPGQDAPTAAAASNILRMASAALPTDLALHVGGGAMTKAAGLAAILGSAVATTSVATLSYQFFTGKIPTQGGVDFLISPTGGNGNNLNSDYYAQFNTVNRYINFAVNLGKVGDGKASFAAKYGSLSLFDATKEAYKTIFGATPTDAKVHALIDGRADYLASYGGDGVNGIGTKAAMVGFLLAAAATEHVGMYAKANDAFLTDLADGASFAVDLVGVYGKAEYNYAG